MRERVREGEERERRVAQKEWCRRRLSSRLGRSITDRVAALRFGKPLRMHLKFRTLGSDIPNQARQISKALYISEVSRPSVSGRAIIVANLKMPTCRSSAASRLRAA